MIPILLVLLLAVPVVEIYVIVVVGHLIGIWPTLGLLVVTSLLGARLIRSEGSRAWRAFHDAIAAGRPPAREAADGALVLVGGALLLAPGFVTDLVGVFLLVPVTRSAVRRVLTWLTVRRLQRHVAARVEVLPTGRPGARGGIIEGEVVDRPAPRADLADPPARRGSERRA